jgi:hypothetical protein
MLPDVEDNELAAYINANYIRVCSETLLLFLFAKEYGPSVLYGVSSY